MAKIGISEFTFGFAFLYEQTQDNWAGLRSAPVLPNLHEERGLGWDAKLPVAGTDFYYQFKLSERLSRGNAFHIRDGTYDAPYHRLALHPRDNNRQHQRLRELSLTNPNTFYVAPEFDTSEEFNTAFLAGEVSERSRLIPVEECRDYRDAEQHYITFQLGRPPWHEHSEATWHETSVSGRQLEQLYRSSETRWRAIDKRFAEDMFDRAATAIRSAADKERELWSSDASDFFDRGPDRPRIQQVDDDRRGRRLERPKQENLSFLNYNVRDGSDVDGDEPDGTDECICPYDIASKGPITDDDLFDLYNAKQQGVKVVMISDSCHSGSVARFVPITTPPTVAGGNAPQRKVRFLPPQVFLSKRQLSQLGIRRAARASSPPGRYAGLLLAGCQDTEYSYDAYFNGRPNGAFTFVALRSLEGLPASATYRAWYVKIRSALPSQQSAVAEPLWFKEHEGMEGLAVGESSSRSDMS